MCRVPQLVWWTPWKITIVFLKSLFNWVISDISASKRYSEQWWNTTQYFLLDLFCIDTDFLKLFLTLLKTFGFKNVAKIIGGTQHIRNIKFYITCPLFAYPFNWWKFSVFPRFMLNRFKYPHKTLIGYKLVLESTR